MRSLASASTKRAAGASCWSTPWARNGEPTKKAQGEVVWVMITSAQQ